MKVNGIFCDGCARSAGPLIDLLKVQRELAYEGWTKWVCSDTGEALDFCRDCTNYRSSYGKRPKLSEISILNYDLSMPNDEEYRFLFSTILKEQYSLGRSKAKIPDCLVRVLDEDGHLWLISTAERHL